MRALQFAQLPIEDGDDNLPPDDHAALTGHAIDQATEMLRAPEEEEDHVVILLVCSAQYEPAMRRAIERRQSKAHAHVIAVPNGWLRRPDVWLASRAGGLAVVSAL